MKSFSEFYKFIKESQPSSFTLMHDNNKVVPSMKHYDNSEMAEFLKTDEGKMHHFLGVDQHGKPHTGKLS